MNNIPKADYEQLKIVLKAVPDIDEDDPNAMENMKEYIKLWDDNIILIRQYEHLILKLKEISKFIEDIRSMINFIQDLDSSSDVPIVNESR